MTETTPPPPGRRRRWGIGIIVAATLVVVAVTTWIIVAADARSNVVAVPQSLTCGSVTPDFAIQTPDGPTPDELPQPAFEFSAGPGTACNLTVAVGNTGSRSVRIRTIEFPGMSPAPPGGPMIVVSRHLDSDAEPRQHDGDRTAVFDIDQTIGAGETLTAQFEVRHNAGSSRCYDSLFTELSSSLPVVTTSALGLGGTTRGSVNLVVHGVGKGSKDCA